MITINYHEVKNKNGNARTLDPAEVTENVQVEAGVEYTRTHNDGWTITGIIYEDYYVWVNTFRATHPTFGEVTGDFEYEITATSQEALDHFLKHHMYSEWDYSDI